MSKLNKKEYTGLADLYVRLYEQYLGYGGQVPGLLVDLEKDLQRFCQVFGENFSPSKWESYLDKRIRKEGITADQALGAMVKEAKKDRE